MGLRSVLVALTMAVCALAGSIGPARSLTETTITLTNVLSEAGQTVTTTVSIETLATGDSVNSFSLVLSIDGAVASEASSSTIEAPWTGLPIEPPNDGTPGLRVAAAGFQTGVGCALGPCELFKVTWQLLGSSTSLVRIEGILAGEHGPTGAIEVPFKVVGGTTMSSALVPEVSDKRAWPSQGDTGQARGPLAGGKPNASVLPEPLGTIDPGLAVFALFALGAVGWTLLRWRRLLRTSRAFPETETRTDLDPEVQRAIGSFLDFVEERGRLARPLLIVSTADAPPEVIASG